MVRKKAQVCPKCKKPAATLLEWPQVNWWPGVLCWPCVQEHIEKDHEELEAAEASRRASTELRANLERQLEAVQRELQAVVKGGTQILYREWEKREAAERKYDDMLVSVGRWRYRYEEAERRLSEALEVLKETLDYLPYPSGTSIVSKNQARIRERVNNICQARAVLASQTGKGQ